MVIIGNCWYTVVTVLRKSSHTVTIKGLRERTGHNAFNLCTYALSNPPSIFIPEGKTFKTLLNAGVGYISVTSRGIFELSYIGTRSQVDRDQLFSPIAISRKKSL